GRVRWLAERRVNLHAIGVIHGGFVGSAKPPVNSRRAARREPPHGTAGHATGAGVLGCATNRPTRSLAAVDGGLPLAFAGASAHHGRPLPSVRRTAIRPCEGSSRVKPQPGPPPASEIRSAVTATRETGAPAFTSRKR